MKRIVTVLPLIFLTFIVTFITPPQTAFASLPVDVRNDQVTFDFPNAATFSATLSAEAEITSVTLEYGDKQLTCGKVIAKAYPQFTPGKSVNVEWTWDMRQSGSLPPGAQIWWRWRYVDASGAEFVSEEQTATWLDSVHNWQTISEGYLRVHWYGGDRNFAQAMLDAGAEGLRRNQEQAGLAADAPIDIYIYANYEDLRDAILYEPGWVGGQAFAAHNVFIMGVSSSDMEWNKGTVVHELTHILVGHFTFSCIGSTPGWLTEGLAMFSEGGLDSGAQYALDSAVKNDTLIALRSLSGEFSENSDKANLSYAQSYSVVNFLIETHGQAKMTQLLEALRDSKPIDDALLEVYGFDTDGLEDAWRKSINAAPRAVSAQPTSMPTPTYVPTYPPVSGAPVAGSPMPTAAPSLTTPTPRVAPGENNPPQSREPGSASPWSDTNFLILTAMLCCAGLLMAIVIGVFVVGFIVRRDNAKAKGKNHA